MLLSENRTRTYEVNGMDIAQQRALRTTRSTLLLKRIYPAGDVDGGGTFESV